MDFKSEIYFLGFAFFLIFSCLASKRSNSVKVFVVTLSMSIQKNLSTKFLSTSIDPESTLREAEINSETPLADVSGKTMQAKESPIV
jgi:hypothetical protein